jgi:hypothetical protein
LQLCAGRSDHLDAIGDFKAKVESRNECLDIFAINAIIWITALFPAAEGRNDTSSDHTTKNNHVSKLFQNECYNANEFFSDVVKCAYLRANLSHREMTGSWVR